MKQSDLKHIYSPVPQGFHDALHAAAQSVKEEQPMKRTGTFILVCILILALACGTALAIVSYYSVRQFQAGGTPSDTFEKNITELNRTFENDYIIFTITDAVFDGDEIALAMDISPKNPDKPVFLYPKLTAACNERVLDVDIQGMRGDFHSGFLLPKQTDDDDLQGHYGFTAGLFEDYADGNVTWTFTMQVLAPNWPVRNEDMEPRGEENDFEAYKQRFRDAYERQEILTTWGESLVEYAAWLPVPDGMTEEEFQTMRLGNQLAQSGAFTLVDTIVCNFDTAMPEERWQNIGVGLTFPMADYTVEFAGMDLSFMRVAYAFDLVFPTGTTLEEIAAMEGLHYTLLDQNGKELRHSYSSKNSLERENGTKVLRYEGEAYFSQDIPTEIHFVPEELQGNDWKTDETAAFAIPVEAGEVNPS